MTDQTELTRLKAQAEVTRLKAEMDAAYAAADAVAADAAEEAWEAARAAAWVAAREADAAWELEQLQAALIAACMAWATARTVKEKVSAFHAFQNAAHAIKNAVGGTL